MIAKLQKPKLEKLIRPANLYAEVVQFLRYMSESKNKKHFTLLSKYEIWDKHK